MPGNVCRHLDSTNPQTSVDFFRATRNDLESLVGLGGLALYIGMVIGIGRLAIWTTTTFATFRGNPKATQRRLRATNRRRWARRDMEVVRCTRDDWKESVAAILDVVDLAIIDGTESTEDLTWEIELAQYRIGNDGVLLFSCDEPAPANGLHSPRLEYDAHRALEEIEAFSQELKNDQGEGLAILGSYGHELAHQLHAWMEIRKG